jgi:hypothetical protein
VSAGGAGSPDGGRPVNCTSEVVTVDPDAATDMVGKYGRSAISLALDRSNGLHVSYAIAELGISSFRQVKYAFKPAGGSWSTSVLDPQPGAEWSNPRAARGPTCKICIVAPTHSRLMEAAACTECARTAIIPRR